MIFKTFISLLLLCFFSFKSQTSRLTIIDKKATAFYHKIKNSTLLVPVKDKANHEDSVLIESLGRYWKVSPYKTISQKEFNEFRKNKTTVPGFVYLLKETYERLKYSRMDWAYTKYFITSEPGGVEIMDAPYIEFKLPVKSKNKDIFIIDHSFIYGLMIKQMNYDIELMNDKQRYYSIKRNSLIKVNFKKALKTYAHKTMLVAQADMENYMMNIADDKKKDIKVSEFINYISSKTKIDTSRIRFVPEEEIQKVVSLNDTGSLVYTGFTIYNAADGKMLRRIDVSSGKRKIHSAFTLSLSAIMIAAGFMLLTLRT